MFATQQTSQQTVDVNASAASQPEAVPQASSSWFMGRYGTQSHAEAAVAGIGVTLIGIYVVPKISSTVAVGYSKVKGWFSKDKSKSKSKS